MEGKINEVEYMSDGSCSIGIRESSHDLKRFVLSQYCCKITWLSRFRVSDLDIIWRLTKRQYRVFSVKRWVALVLIQCCLFKYKLNSWEADLQNYVAGIEDECDEW